MRDAVAFVLFEEVAVDGYGEVVFVVAEILDLELSQMLKNQISLKDDSFSPFVGQKVLFVVSRLVSQAFSSLALNFSLLFLGVSFLLMGELLRFLRGFDAAFVHLLLHLLLSFPLPLRQIQYHQSYLFLLHF